VGWKQNADRIEHDNQLGRSKLAWILNPQGALQIPNYFQGMILKAKEMLKGRTVFVVEPTSLDKAHYMS
jgi:hypothetical protein